MVRVQRSRKAYRITTNNTTSVYPFDYSAEIVVAQG